MYLFREVTKHSYERVLQAPLFHVVILVMAKSSLNLLDVGTIANVNAASTNITMNGTYYICANFREEDTCG
ncbi:MAG: hypothetical protein MUO80_05110 [Dehalococcoidia bacterium]|nr:hypothetical protein [Dehalococcoidia bacterium]